MYRYHRIVGTMVANHWKPSFPMVDCLKNHWKTIGPNGWAGNHSINGNGDHENYWFLAMVLNFLLSFLVEAEIKQKKCCYICALTHRNNWEHHFWYPGTIFFSKIHHILIYWVFLVLCWMLHVCICGFCIFVFFCVCVWDTWLYHFWHLWTKSFQKIYSLYGLKHHKVEMSPRRDGTTTNNKWR